MNEIQRGVDRVEGDEAAAGQDLAAATSFLDRAIDALERAMPDLPTLGALVLAFALGVVLSGGTLFPDIEWVAPVDGVVTWPIDPPAGK